MSDTSEDKFFNMYFWNVDISLIINAINLKFCVHIENITAEGNVSQICYIGPDLFCINFRKKYSKK